MHVILVRDKLPLGHVMLIGALRLRRETAHIALSGKEVIPQEVRSQPAPVIRAIFIDIVNEAHVLFRLFRVLHEAEQGALRCAKVLGNDSKQRERHWMQRAKLTEALFFVAHVQIVEVREVLADRLHQLIFLCVPLFVHSGAG